MPLPCFARLTESTFWGGDSYRGRGFWVEFVCTVPRTACEYDSGASRGVISCMVLWAKDTDSFAGQTWG